MQILGIAILWVIVLVLAAARIGRQPRFPWQMLVKPISLLAFATVGFAAVAAVFGYALAGTGNVVLTPEVKQSMPPREWGKFQAMGFAQSASYYVAFVGGGMLAVWVWMFRKRLRIR